MKIVPELVSERGNERARKKFKVEKYPELTESTVRNLKKRYLERLALKRKKLNPQPVREIHNQERGSPPLLLELDEKLIRFLKPVRTKGGVVNIHVVRATATALIKSNSSLLQQFARFEMPKTWVQSIYRCMGFTRWIGTTSRPPVPYMMNVEEISSVISKTKSQHIQFQLTWY